LVLPDFSVFQLLQSQRHLWVKTGSSKVFRLAREYYFSLISWNLH